MTLLEAPIAREKVEDTPIRAHVVFALWIAALVLLVLFLGNPPVTRTQEARVLETARQMLGQPAIDWLIPKLNGSPRLQKPPLTYWMSAAGFSIGGVNEFAGRFGTAIVGWLTLAVTYLGGKWLFGQRAGLLASATLLGSYFFYRHSRLAETDIPAVLFVTIGILSAWRAADEGTTSITAAQSAAPGGIASRERNERNERNEMPPGASLWAAVDETRHSTSFAREAMWFHVAAAATGFAILSKGAPGAFVGLFLVGLILIERRWSLAWNFLRSGALVTLVVIALPWFVFVGMHAGWGTFTAELNNNIEGGDHAGSMFQYVPELFVATAPWCGLMPIAIFAAIKQRRDVRMRRLLIWILAIAIPLCIEGNKQKHYLLPLMPPIMLLVGWLIDRSIARRDGVFGLARVIMWIMGGLTALAAIGVLIAGYMVHKRITGIDVVMVVALFSFAALLGALWRQGAAVGIAGTVAVSTILMPLVSGLWAPTLATNTAREVASQLTQSFGSGPYGFVSGDISLPLCWEMRTAIPQYETPAEALAAAQREPNLAAISLAKDKRAPAQLPPPWVKKLSLRSEERILEVYQLAR